jgi:hypothetical protein
MLRARRSQDEGQLVNPILQKLRFNGQDPVLLLNAPPEFEPVADDFGVSVHREIRGRYKLAIAFVKSRAEAMAAATATRNALVSDGIFWLVYPKGTSKKYPKVDVNRDTGTVAVEGLGFKGVTMVAIDEDWSAMRYKPAVVC